MRCGHTSGAMTEVELRTERIDDLPVLLAVQRQMGIGEVLDAVIRPHGNRGGLSVGDVAMVCCFHPLSQIHVSAR